MNIVIRAQELEVVQIRRAAKPVLGLEPQNKVGSGSRPFMCPLRQWIESFAMLWAVPRHDLLFKGMRRVSCSMFAKGILK